jgi:hypothetical protein
MKKILVAASSILFLAVAVCVGARAGEHVKLTGYLVDSMCAAGHAHGSAEEAEAFGAKHTKSCALDTECAASGFGIISDGKYYPFDAKGNEMAKALFEKTSKNDHIQATVEGEQQDNKIAVSSLTEVP